MKLLQEKLTIVLAGAFNPAILTPQWIAKNALGYEQDQLFQVEMLAPVAGFAASPRFSFDFISYTANYKGATFHLADRTPDEREKVCEAISKLLGELPHTPINGLGLNFSFKVEDPGADLLALFNVHAGMTAALGDDAEVVSRAWANTISLNDALINIQSQLDGTELSVDVNFHHNVSSTAAAAALMHKPGTYAEHYDLVLAAVSALTGQQLEE